MIWHEYSQCSTCKTIEANACDTLVSFSLQVSAAEEQADAPSVLVTDTEPRFELKGMTFPSAPPLSSDSSHCDVYTSDKLNFR